MPKRYFPNPYTATQNIKQDATFWKSKISQIVQEIVQHQKLGRRDLGWWRNKSNHELNIINSIFLYRGRALRRSCWGWIYAVVPPAQDPRSDQIGYIVEFTCSLHVFEFWFYKRERGL